MKIRMALVSNSSSCSFTVYRKDCTKKQIYMIKNYSETAKSLGITGTLDGWQVNSIGPFLKFSTDMDNFDMEGFLDQIGIDHTKRHDTWHSNG